MVLARPLDSNLGDGDGEFVSGDGGGIIVALSSSLSSSRRSSAIGTLPVDHIIPAPG